MIKNVAAISIGITHPANLHPLLEFTLTGPTFPDELIHDFEMLIPPFLSSIRKEGGEYFIFPLLVILNLPFRL